MPRIAYIEKNFRDSTSMVIFQAQQIIEEYQNQGFSLTLRQLFYQFVSRALIPNTQKNYKRLGSIVNDGRLAGYLDWLAIEDRTRSLKARQFWDTPTDVIKSAAWSFRRDRWATQPCRVEVWIEKEALAGVFAPMCMELEVPYFCCKGYPSQSEVWRASQRLIEYQEKDQIPTILHFGDHDPSGMDMTHDIRNRMALFGVDLTLERMALNWDQVQAYDPPPNPAKLTDSRASGYVREYGYESWELDALEPSVLAKLVEDAVLAVRDEEAWTEALEEDQEDTDTLTWVASNWEKVSKLRGED